MSRFFLRICAFTMILAKVTALLLNRLLDDT